MDTAIQIANERLEYITSDEDARRAYELRFTAMCDLTSIQDHAHKTGVEKGMKKGRAEILKLLRQGLSIEEIEQRVELM